MIDKLELSKQAVYDGIGNASAKKVSITVMKLLNAMQDELSDVQVAAVSVLFLTLCAKSGIEPYQALLCADNIIRQAKRYDKGTFKGVSDYMENEIKL